MQTPLKRLCQRRNWFLGSMVHIWACAKALETAHVTEGEAAALLELDQVIKRLRCSWKENTKKLVEDQKGTTLP